MVDVSDTVPDAVLEGDPAVFASLRDTTEADVEAFRKRPRDERVRLLAREWYREFHGSPHDSKVLFVMLMKQLDIPFNGEDIQRITRKPAVWTQT